MNEQKDNQVIEKGRILLKDGNVLINRTINIPSFQDVFSGNKDKNDSVTTSLMNYLQ